MLDYIPVYYSIFDQINANLNSIRDVLQKNLTNLKLLNSSKCQCWLFVIAF